jgi:hypothetical protein
LIDRKILQQHILSKRVVRTIHKFQFQVSIYVSI